MKAYLLRTIFLVFFGIIICQSQDLNEVLIALTDLQQGQQMISNHLTELQIKQAAIENTLQTVRQDLQTKQETIENTLQSLKKGQQRARSSLQQCATLNQVESFREMFTTNECEEGTHNCSPQAICIDTLVSFECTCITGYSGDGVTCQDIDECQTGLHECHQHSTCNNTIGSYTCQCIIGFHGDGRTCDGRLCEYPYEVLDGAGCLYYVRMRKTWSQAQDNCIAIARGHLYEKGSHEVYKLIIRHFSIGFSTWIGMRELKWVNNDERVAHELWENEEPEEDQDMCGYIYPFSNISISSCQTRYASLCQIF